MLLVFIIIIIIVVVVVIDLLYFCEYVWLVRDSLGFKSAQGQEILL